MTWTGTGSLKIPKASGIEFGVNSIPMTGNYKLILRFHPKVNIKSKIDYKLRLAQINTGCIKKS